MTTPSDLTRGTIFQSNNFGLFAVLKYNNKNEVQIVFLNTLHVGVYRAQAVRKGKVKDHSLSIIKGKTYPSNNFGDVKVIAVKNSREVEVEFLDTQHRHTVRAAHLLAGNIKDNSLLITVGYIYPSNNYGLFEVIEVINFSLIKIRFLETGGVASVRGDHIKTGSVKDPSKNTITVGDLFLTNQHGEIEILEVGRHKIKVKFLNTDSIRVTYRNQIKLGEVRDLTVDITPEDMIQGHMHKANNGDFMRVIRYGSADDVDVEFLSTGYIYKSTKAKQVRDGSVQDKSLWMQVGEVYNSNRCGKMEVINYEGSSNVTVLFLDSKTVVNTQASRIRIGEVVDPTVDQTPVDMNIGSRFFHDELGEYAVEEYQSSDHVLIRFMETNTTKVQTSTQVRTKVVSDPTRPSIHGFDKTKPANLYLVHWFGLGNEYLKFGITNRAAEERIRQQNRVTQLNYQILNVYHFETGFEALKVEDLIKSQFECCACPKLIFPDGYTETMQIEFYDSVVKLIEK